MRTSVEKNQVLKAGLIGLLILLAQILSLWWITGNHSFPKYYRSLCSWDCDWFASIIEGGYTQWNPALPKESGQNGAFFPALPVLGWLVRCLLRTSPHVSVLVAAHLCVWTFWTYLLLTLKLLHAGTARLTTSVFAMFCHPAAYFLVFGYSEAPLLAAMMGTVYWTLKSGERNWIKLAAHGVVMTSARLVGVVTVWYPFLTWFFQGADKRKFKIPLSSLLGLCGVLIYFIYCHFKFGRWDQYIFIQGTVWGVAPDYFALFRPKNYSLYVGLDNLISLIISVSIVGGLILDLISNHVKPLKSHARHGWQTRVPLLLCAFGTHYLAFSAFAPKGMVSLSRYSLPTLVLILLAANHWANEFGAAIPKWARSAMLGLAGFFALFFYMRFTSGQGRGFLLKIWTG